MVIHAKLVFGVLLGLLLTASHGLALCIVGELVDALALLRFSGSIWQVLQLVGNVAGQSLLMHGIWSMVSAFLGS